MMVSIQNPLENNIVTIGMYAWYTQTPQTFSFFQEGEGQIWTFVVPNITLNQAVEAQKEQPGQRNGYNFLGKIESEPRS